MADALIREETRKIQKQLNHLIKLTIKQHDMAKDAIAKNNKELALQALDHDKKIDGLFLQLKADVEFLITKRPLGKELRRTLGYFEMASDIERIADYAKYIAKFVLKSDSIAKSTQTRIRLIHKPFRNMLLELIGIIEAERVEKAIALADMDAALDKAVNSVRFKIFTSVAEKTSTAEVTERIFAFSVVNALERAGDHIVHMCEAVFYIATGEHSYDRDLN